MNYHIPNINSECSGCSIWWLVYQMRRWWYSLLDKEKMVGIVKKEMVEKEDVENHHPYMTNTRKKDK